MEAPDIIMFIMSLIIVLTGFFCAKYPHLIAGINNMKPEEKAKVNLKGLGKFTRNTMILMGVAMLVVYYLLDAMGMEKEGNIAVSTVLVSIIWLIPFFIGSQKYIRK